MGCVNQRWETGKPTYVILLLLSKVLGVVLTAIVTFSPEQVLSGFNSLNRCGCSQTLTSSKGHTAAIKSIGKSVTPAILRVYIYIHTHLEPII